MLTGRWRPSAGNLYGLQERTVAVESLMAAAPQLTQAKVALQALLPASEHARLDAFFQRTVGAAADLRDHIVR